MAVDVTYWSDPLCIWAYVSQDKVDALRTQFQRQLCMRHRIVPVFGSVPWRFAQGSWKDGGPEGRASATAKVAKQFGHDDVDGRAWLNDAPASSWTIGAAVEAVAALEAAGEAPADSSEQYAQALRRAFFVDGLNTARRQVQAQVASSMALDWDAVRARIDDGRADAKMWENHLERERLGIQGSPTWVFDGGRAVLYGNVALPVLVATVQGLLEGESAGCSPCE